jgi:hypothetical protein
MVTLSPIFFGTFSRNLSAISSRKGAKKSLFGQLSNPGFAGLVLLFQKSAPTNVDQWQKLSLFGKLEKCILENRAGGAR